MLKEEVHRLKKELDLLNMKYRKTSDTRSIRSPTRIASTQSMPALPFSHSRAHPPHLEEDQEPDDIGYRPMQDFVDKHYVFLQCDTCRLSQHEVFCKTCKTKMQFKLT